MIERDSLYSIKELQDKSDYNIALVVFYSTSNDNPLDHLSWVEDSLGRSDDIDVKDNDVCYEQVQVLFDLFTTKGNSEGRFVMADFTSKFSLWESKVINEIDRDSIKVVESINITYKNYKGEVSSREIIPLGNITFDSNEFHKAAQWLMPAYDVDKQDIRTFAFKDIISINNID